MYQALYRKYRPKTFDEVVGQKSVTDTLKSQLTSGRLSHAYLFTGTRGTGKTSCAKILAKAVNCLHPIDGNPCNSCAACRAIESGSCTDVQEIDAASNNGVDNVRTLRDDAVYTPAEVKKRVYIIDEVHMLSMAAFNALLKTIEEPPEHLLFILATTELHKVPATILSRCQRFSFRRLLPQDIASRMSYVAYQEQINIEPEAIQLLSRLADGALRDGMSLLDQCASAATDNVSVESIYRCLGLAGEQKTVTLMNAVAQKDVKTALELFAQLYAEGKDLAAMMDELTSVARDLLILKAAPDSDFGMLTGIGDLADLKILQQQFTAQELLRIVSILQETTLNFSRSSNQRIDAELCLIQLCKPELSLDAKALNARISRLEEWRKSGAVLCPPTAAAAVAEESSVPVQNDEPKVQPLPKIQEQSQEEQAADDSFWPELAERIRSELKPPVSGFFAAGPGATIVGKRRSDTLLLVANDPFVKGMVDKPAVLELIKTKAAAFFEQAIAVKIVIKGQESTTYTQHMEELISFSKQHSDIVTIHNK